MSQRSSLSDMEKSLSRLTLKGLPTGTSKTEAAEIVTCKGI